MLGGGVVLDPPTPTAIPAKVVAPAESEELSVVTPCPYERYRDPSDVSAAPIERLRGVRQEPQKRRLIHRSVRRDKA